MSSRRTPSKSSPKPPTVAAGAPPPRANQSHTDSMQRGRSEMYAGPYDDADRYRLIDKRSHGGEGDLWRGVLPLDSIEIPVAVKVILPSNTGRLHEWRERWQRQAELLRSCEHPGLVKVRDIFEGPVPHHHGDRTGDPSLYLVMNWVEGPSVEQWVELAPDRSTSAVLTIASQVAAAIDHLHSGAVAGVGVIHRDIKPANVVMGPNGPCLVDFGFARLHNEEQMTLVGTPSYLAPEIVLGGRYGPSTDRYAFGGTVYYALTGQRPDVAAPAAMKSRLGAVAGFRGIDEAINRFMAMLSPHPDRRPQSCSEWLVNVTEAAGFGPGVSAAEEKTGQPGVEATS